MARATAQKLAGRSSKELAQDDLVMSTNSSSIVSKRSVERIYYPNEPHFFRFFVKKFQRRSPLINRGYHLRLHVIDVAVRDFLKRPSDKKKVVINLGAGSDVLPWQCMTRYPDHCHGAKFIDVDFPDLMSKKSKIVQDTTELSSMLNTLETGTHPHLLLQSDQYVQIGCDLRNLEGIQEAMSSVVSIHDSEFMFIAEVSITYMETEAADAVIHWASSLGQTEFCLLEQILPDGADHPFAETMLKHFEKLKTPLKSVFSYPDLQAQANRFTRLGWSRVEAESLWSTWSSDKYLSSEERRRLNEIEPFDEWEEFALFGGHYCVVTAHTRTVGGASVNGSQEAPESKSCHVLSTSTDFSHNDSRGQRRFGAPMAVKSPLGGRYVLNTFGLGISTRLRSFDLYSDLQSAKDMKVFTNGPKSRMCHSIVDLGDYGNLLVGGRASPSSPLKDCWLFDKISRYWQKVEDLPVPLYRHAVTRIDGSLVLVIGGKTGSSAVFGGSLLYHPDSGWVECEISGSMYKPVSGAVLVSLGSQAQICEEEVTKSSHYHGILAGGLLEDGTISKQTLHWNLEIPKTGRPIVKFDHFAKKNTVTKSDSTTGQISSLHRYGASAVADQNGRVLVLGGVIEDQVIPKDQELILIEIVSGKGDNKSRLEIIAAGPLLQHGHGSLSIPAPRPLLVGFSMAPTRDGRLVIMGGGCTVFSMGTYWNKGCYTLSHGVQSPEVPPDLNRKPCKTIWNFNQTFEITDESNSELNTNLENSRQRAKIVGIPRLRLESLGKFAEVLKAGKPVIIEGSDLGSCVSTWTSDHLVAQVGQDHKVVIHESSTNQMDFNTKNFSYVTKDFGTFMTEVEQGRHMYLRALSEDGPADKPANLNQDFPRLAEEFQLPEELSFVSQNTFSAVLRISGRANIWLHYDVMANIYCQIVGSKRLVLFPPQDVTKLSLAPGASSSSLNVFAELDSPSLAGTHPHEAILKPGEILFLPPLWLHTAAPLTNLGVAVNVFFRNLQSGYSAERDVYGNRDLAAYEKGRQYVAKMVNSFNKVPRDMQEFYVRRLADELLQKLDE